MRVVKTIGTEYGGGVDHETLIALGRADARAKARLGDAHKALVRAIWEAADQGMQQVEIVRDTGLTRERIRQLCDSKYRAKHKAAVLGEPGKE
jgi:hypothetical protein